MESGKVRKAFYIEEDILEQVDSLLQQADVLVKGAKNIHGLLQPLNADSLFQGITPVSPGHQPPDSSVGSV